MNDYDNGNNESPFNQSYSIESIVIESGVTSIGDTAFYYCENLTDVTIPGSVTVIGGFAFEPCSYFCEKRLTKRFGYCLLYKLMI